MGKRKEKNRKTEVQVQGILYLNNKFQKGQTEQKRGEQHIKITQEHFPELKATRFYIGNAQ